MIHKLIILVDDDEEDLTFLRSSLRKQIPEAIVIEFANGVETVNYLQEKADLIEIALIVTDLNMPMMNGLELIEAVRAIPQLRRIPLVLLSSHPPEIDAKQAISQRDTFYVTKPPTYSGFDSIVTDLRNRFLAV